MEGHWRLRFAHSELKRLTRLEKRLPIPLPEELTRLEGHFDFISSAIFLPDGQRVLTASFDRTARVERNERSAIAKLEGHCFGLFSAVFSPHEQRVLTAICSDGTALIFTTVSANEIASLLASK